MIDDNRVARDGRAPTAGPELNAPRAKQGDRRSSTFWILFMAVILAAIVGVVLLSTTEEYTADRPEAAQEAPAQNATPTNPGQQAPPPQQ
jgi:hypothetical protein